MCKITEQTTALLGLCCFLDCRALITSDRPSGTPSVFQDETMATEVAPILVPRADDGAGQLTPTAAHTPMSPMLSQPMSPVLSPKVAKPTDPVELAAAIRKQVRTVSAQCLSRCTQPQPTAPARFPQLACHVVPN
jgi:hypothetical protein